MDADSGGPASPLPSPAPPPSTIVFRDWHSLFVFLGNARVAIASGEWPLFAFTQIPRASEPRFSDRDWPSYHHAALSLCGNILAAVEHALDRMKLADMPQFGPLPMDVEKRLRALVTADFDPAILQQGCINEAARAGLTTGTWREPTPSYSGNFRATLTTVPIPGDDEKPTQDVNQLHLDYFYMLGALCSSRTAPVNVPPKPTLPLKAFPSVPPTTASPERPATGSKEKSKPSLTLREKNILEAIGNAVLSGPQIAEKAGYEYNSALRAALSNMVKRDMIEKTDDGYRAVR